MVLLMSGVSVPLLKEEQHAFSLKPTRTDIASSTFVVFCHNAIAYSLLAKAHMATTPPTTPTLDFWNVELNNQLIKLTID